MIPEIFHKKYYFEKNIIQKKKQAIYNSNHLICVSHNTKKDLMSIYNDLDESKISVIYPGRGNFENFKLNKIPEKIKFIKEINYILFVGKRGSYKNFNFFLESISNSKKIIKDFKIICFDINKFNNEELNKHKKFGFLKDSIIHVSGDDYTLGCLYKNAYLLANPSLYEGFGSSPIEAMNLNCPVVSSNGGSSKEVLGDAALFFNPNSSIEMESKCEQLLYDKKLRENYIAKGKKHSSKYSWEKCTKEIIEIYKNYSYEWND